MSSNIRYRTFTQAPINTPFPLTGSFDYRKFYRGRSLTPKEQRFEEFVNGIQARHDKISELVEWRRRKDLEEEAILLYYELGEDMKEFSRQMKTRDQQEMEFQCQRRHKKAKDLDPRHSKECLRAMELEGQRRLRVEEVEERAREQLRVEDAARAEFRIDMEASINPTANTELVTNEHTRDMRSHSYDQWNRRTAIKPCLLLKQTRQGSRYKEQICRKFLDQVPLANNNNNQIESLTGSASSSTQQQAQTKMTRKSTDEEPEIRDQPPKNEDHSNSSSSIVPFFFWQNIIIRGGNNNRPAEPLRVFRSDKEV